MRQRGRIPFWTTALLTLATVGAGGCTGTYDGRYSFRPRPAMLEQQDAEDAAANVRTLVTVVGVHRGDDEGMPRSVHTRLRVENIGDRIARFDPRSIQLLAADLHPFPDPLIMPERVAELPPGSAAIFDTYFPLEDGAGTDLSGLQVSWSTGFAGRSTPGSVTVERYVRPRPPSYRAAAMRRDFYYWGYAHRHWYWSRRYCD